MKPKTLLVALIILVISACQDDDHFIEDLYGCQKKYSWRHSFPEIALAGEWDWVFISCYGYPPFSSHDEYLGVQVTFRLDQSVRLTIPGSPPIEGSYTLKKRFDYYEMETTPFMSFIHGRLILCGDHVYFANSYRDGCDNAFEKRQ